MSNGTPDAGGPFGRGAATKTPPIYLRGDPPADVEWTDKPPSEPDVEWTDKPPTPPPVAGGFFGTPDLNPTAREFQDWLDKQAKEMPGFVQPIMPHSPAEFGTEIVGGFGTGAQYGFPEAAPIIRPLTSVAQLATAGALGAWEAKPGHRLETAEEEMAKTGAGLLLQWALLGSPLHRLGIAKLAEVSPISAWTVPMLAALARTMAPAVGRGAPAILQGMGGITRKLHEYFAGTPVQQLPQIIEGGGGEEK